MRHRSRWAALLVVLAVIAGACSSADDPASDSAAVASTSDGGPESAASGSAEGAGPRELVADAPRLPEYGPLMDAISGYSWDRAGATRSAPSQVLSVEDYGAVPDDGRPDTQAFLDVLEVAEDTEGGAVVSIPPGEFLLNSALRIKNGTVIRGAGPDTRIVVDLGGDFKSPLWVEGWSTTEWRPITTDLSVGDTVVPVADTSEIEVGDIVELEQDNDAAAMYTRPEWEVDWAEGSVGELGEVVAVTADSVTLDVGLFSDYTVDLGVRLRRIEIARDIGIESLTIERIDEEPSPTMYFKYATDVWVSDVESIRTTRAHVGFDRAVGCEVEGSLLHGANDFGDGGRAYGVSIGQHTTRCLIVNNTLYDLRHALIIQLGASGNVFAYNHARGSAGYEERLPRADISIHGHWPQANLYEGNIIDRIQFADWWGPSGPGNTLFRSCVLDFVTVEDQSNDQVIVGNRIASGGLTIDPGIEGTITAGNFIDYRAADPVWIWDYAVPASLWTDSQPDFLDGYPWPALEPDRPCDLPASARSPLGNEE